jgi:Cu-processing system permease protein
MSTAVKISGYQLRDLLRSKWLLAYTAFFFLVTYCLFRFVGDTSKVVVSLTNIVLMIIPLVSTILGTTYYYSSREYTEFMLAQPIKRSSLFTGMCLGISVPLMLSFAAGVGGAVLIYGSAAARDIDAVLTLLIAGVALTFVFVAMAFWVAVVNNDKARGLGASLLLWLLFSVIYDGLVLLSVIVFADYPLEKPMIGLTILNPIDLARVLIMLKFDVSALMGYTGAVFQEFFGTYSGVIVSLASLMTWSLLSFFSGMRSFKKKDF